MSTSGSNLALLKTCGDPAEAAALRSLLDANGLSCVVRGEHHSAMLGGAIGGALIEIDVLVASKDLEQARALLEAEVEAPAGPSEGQGSAATPDTEEALCPVHGSRSTATCGRCGTFLCDRCHIQDPGAPLCEDCVERKGAGNEVRRGNRRKLVAWLVLGFMFGPALLMMVGSVLYRLFHG
jgi:Putative prokaryotic signal transducing protein